MPFVEYIATTFKDFLESGTELMECKKVHTALLTGGAGQYDIETWEYQIDEKDLGQYKSCRQKREGDTAFLCKGFCELFDLTTPNHLIDGDLEQLRTFVKYFHINRKNFAFPENNFIVSSAHDSEYLLDTDFKLMGQEQPFIPISATTDDPAMKINQPNTVVLMEDGADIFLYADNNDYSFFFEGVGLWKMWSALAVILVLIV